MVLELGKQLATNGHNISIIFPLTKWQNFLQSNNWFSTYTPAHTDNHKDFKKTEMEGYYSKTNHSGQQSTTETLIWTTPLFNIRMNITFVLPISAHALWVWDDADGLRAGTISFTDSVFKPQKFSIEAGLYYIKEDDECTTNKTLSLKDNCQVHFSRTQILIHICPWSLHVFFLQSLHPSIGLSINTAKVMWWLGKGGVQMKMYFGLTILLC